MPQSYIATFNKAFVNGIEEGRLGEVETSMTSWLISALGNELTFKLEDKLEHSDAKSLPGYTNCTIYTAKNAKDIDHLNSIDYDLREIMLSDAAKYLAQEMNKIAEEWEFKILSPPTVHVRQFAFLIEYYAEVTIAKKDK